MPKRKKVFYGWWMALVSAILNFFAGGTFFYGFTVFFNPIRDAFGWNATVTSIAFTFQRIEMGILGPLTGFLADRVSPRKLMFAGWSVIGLGFLLMSRINSLWEFYGSFILIAIGFSFGTFVVMTVAVARWFSKKRSRAMTLLYGGTGACGILVPILAWSISQFGWRETLTFTGIGLLITALPLCLVIRDRPGNYGYLPDGEIQSLIHEPTNTPNINSPGKLTDQASVLSTTGFTAKVALRTRAFWLLSLVFLFQHVGTSAVMVHIIPYLESVKIPTTIAATAVTGVTLCSLIGRLGFGLLGDFINKKYLVALAFAFQTIGLFIFSFIDMDRVWLLIPFLLIYSPGYGGPIPLRPALQADYFGVRSFGTILGLMSGVSMIGGLASPIVAGWLFDVTGSYQSAWQLFALVTFPAIPLMLLTKPPEAT